MSQLLLQFIKILSVLYKLRALNLLSSTCNPLHYSHFQFWTLPVAQLHKYLQIRQEQQTFYNTKYVLVI